MQLRALQLHNFKNYTDLTIQTAEHFSCLVGANGAGKTNLLEAIHYLAFCRSARSGRESHNLRHGERGFRIAGRFQSEDREMKVEVRFRQGQGGGKEVHCNGEKYEKFSTHIGRIPLILSSPFDSELVEGYSEARRRLMDATIAQVNPEYLENLIRYNRYLTQRNALLKSAREGKSVDPALIDAFDPGLIETGTQIFEVRQAFAESVTPIFSELYKHISGDREQTTLSYRSGLSDKPLSQILRDARRDDEYLGRTTKGIHRDDLVCELGGHPIKEVGSQGQKKTYLTALKLALGKWLAARTQASPILLLDDVFDKLDRNRIEALFEILGIPGGAESGFGQVWLTDTNADRIRSVFSKLGLNYSGLRVEDGQIKPLDPAQIES